jgi:dihydrolipoamide dehydrogenase
MESYDLVIIGSGPGGYVAAIRAAQLGIKTCIIERHAVLGGTCLNVGCIPSKALLESSELYHAARTRYAEHGIVIDGDGPGLDLGAMMARKQRIVKELTDGVAGLMKKNKVTVLRGTASLVARDRVKVALAEGSEQEVGASQIILATGSRPVELPFLPFDKTRVVSSTGALSFDAVPGHLAVIGAGAVGLELGSVWCRLGARVTVVEMMPQIVPGADGQMAKTLARSLKAQGLDLRVSTRVTGARFGDGEAQVQLALEDKKGRSEELAVDRVLVAVGRRPVSEGIGLEAAGVEVDERGFVKVDAKLRTTAEGIYAIGDLVRGPALAHKAEEEGIAAVEIIAGKPGHVSYDAIPGVIYTAPELAWVGLTDEQCKEQGIKPRVGRFLFRANGRAKSLGEEEGMVKILAHPDTDRVLGVHIVGPRASDLIPEGVLALEFKASAEDLARTVHAHPTLAETVKEAALAVDGRAIHA